MLLEDIIAESSFWDDNQKAQSILKKLSTLKDEIANFDNLYKNITYVGEILEMSSAEGEDELYRETVYELKKLNKQYLDYELLVLFSDPYDLNNAIVSLHSGAGGTEAQDWVEILFRMYSRWAESSNYAVEILDFLAGDEAGIKGITFLVSGSFAYGKLKCEDGVHRLIRISPFDASGRRHTSFASVAVLPEIIDNEDIIIKPNDIKIDTYRASGAGGQHVNKTDSAVRITHLATNTVVQCQNQRSQHANKLAAMKILTAKLHKLREAEQADELLNIKGDYKEIAWGNQIRTYTLNPFTLVKDHRTNIEVGNANAVLDGELDDFIYACLQQNV